MPGHFPIAPANQSAAVSEILQFQGPSSGVRVCRSSCATAPGRRPTRSRRPSCSTYCPDRTHVVIEVVRYTDPGSQGAAFHHLPLPGVKAADGSAPTDTYELLVRVADQLSLTQLTGPSGDTLDRDQLLRSMRAVADRLAGRVPAPLD